MNRAMKCRCAVGIVAVLLLAIAGPAAAADPGWKVKVTGVWVDPDFRWESVSEFDERQTAESSSDIGFGLGLEYRISDRLGVELAASWTDPEIAVHYELPDLIDIRDTDTLSFNPITVALNIYLTPNGSVGVYLAPMVAFVQYGDLEYNLGMFCEPGMLCTVQVQVDDDVGWGAALGIDVPLGDRGWVLSGSVGYLDTDLEVTDPDGDTESFGFDPVTATLGIAYRF